MTADASQPHTTPGHTSRAGVHTPLVIVDDFLPNILSGFRVAEFNAYLAAFPDVRIRSTLPPDRYERALKEYAKRFPAYAASFAPFDPNEDFGEDPFIFVCFLNNAAFIAPLCEARSIPFGFQLCPGGGFAFNEERCDRMLARVMRSPMLSCVVTTQPITQAYLLQRHPEAAAISTMVCPGPVWGADMEDVYRARPAARAKRTGLDLAFVAAKYADNVSNKGFDFFCAMADEIAAIRTDVRFHIVGDWTPSDVPLGLAAEATTFYGMLTNDKLCELYVNIDMLISPNIPYSLTPGNFDGFPTASASEAALAGVVLAASDPLKLNHLFEPGRDFILLERDIRSIKKAEVKAAAAKVMEIAGDPKRLAEMSAATHDAFQENLGPKAQVEPRVAFLRRALAREMPPPATDASRWREASQALARELFEQRALSRDHYDLLQQSNAYVADKDARIGELVADLEKHGAKIQELANLLDQSNRYGQSRDQAVAKSVEAQTTLAKAMSEKDAKIAELAAALENANAYAASRSAIVTDLVATLDAKDARIAELVSDLGSYDGKVAELAAALDNSNTYAASRSTIVNDLVATVEAKDARIAELVTDLERNGAKITELASALENSNAYGGSRDAAITDLLAAIASKDAGISELATSLDNSNAYGASRDEAVAATIESLKRLSDDLASKETALAELQVVLTQRDGEISALRAQLSEAQAELAEHKSRADTLARSLRFLR